MVSFGAGQTAEGIKNTAFNTFLLFFYQQVLGVPGVLTGLALAIALIFDAITDPIAGSISDKTRTRWGRRHPFILLSSVPLALGFFAIFNPPQGASHTLLFVWLTVGAILVRGSLTFYHVPHLALGAEMAQDYHQRSTLFAFSTMFSAIGSAAIAFFAYRMFFPTNELFNPGLLNQQGYFGFSLATGGIAVTSILICVLGTRKEIPHLQPPGPQKRFTLLGVVRELKALFSNTSFRVLFIGMLFATTSLAVEAVLTPYMGVHFWGLTTEEMAYLPVGLLLGLFVSVPLTPFLTRRFDKRPTMVAAALITIVNLNALVVLRLLDVDWLPGNDSPWILWLMVLRYFLGGCIAPIIYNCLHSMFADIADEQELETHERREGVIYSARSFTQKLTGAAGVIMGGAVIDIIAFPVGAEAGSVDANTLWWLGFAEGPGTSVFTIIGVLFYMRYRLNATRHAEIKAELAARAAGASNSAG